MARIGMTKEKIDYFITSLDFYLSAGKSPQEALLATVEDYMIVYHPSSKDMAVKDENGLETGPIGQSERETT